MSLEKYLEKRDLTRTPEPGPKQRKPEKVLRFVVQKHAASHLHYDFRLELDGVLKSWAIPKGPSLDPSIRRLAMMVEDHPYDYRNFEGIIPKGNYGAGEVMVWDEGTYHAAGSDDGRKSEELLREGLRKGDLKFVLEGHKLNGEFALVRMRTEKENTWLLIKKHDDYATTEDVTLNDRSVVSNATLQEIKEGTVPPPRPEEPPAESAPEDIVSQPESTAEATAETKVPQTERAAEAKKAAKPHNDERGTEPMPHNVRPMLASSAAEPFDDPDWIFEIKLDGYRCIAEIESGNVSIYSRNNLSFNNRFPNIVRSLESIRRDAVFDGEVAALDESGRSSFQLLQNHQRTGEGNIVLYLFDILYLDGKDLSRLPLLTRKEILRDLLPDLPNIRYSDHIAGSGKDFFDLAQKNSLEGIIAKRSSSQYQAGRRTRDWLKIKIRLQQEAVICGFTAPRGSRKKFGSLVLGVYENNELVYIGLTGGGFDDAGLQEMYRLLEPLVQPHSPFKEKIKTDTPVKWVKPELVCEITFSEWTGERIMRQPIFLGMREDKDPRQVVRELFQGELEEAPAGEPEVADEPAPEESAEQAPEVEKRGKGKNMVLVIDGKRLELSNLDKVFWPEEGYTKGDVIDYYRKVAHIILPHLQDRPESLYRTPHGITGHGFFQKEAGELPPPWMTTKEIYSKHVDKDIKFFVCQDEATLIYMANLGCIEINPWLSRIQSLNYPDYFVIDLDPEDIEFEKVIETALAVHEVLERAGAASYPKTSGATGIHIFVPLGAKYDYETAEKFAKILVTLVHHKIPDFTSLLRSPSKRQKKVYLDFLQNKAGQTLAAPYSIRPKPGATVSAPLRWDEVKSGLHPSQFTIRNMPERIEHVGDLFSGVLGPGIDIEKCLENLEKE
jgi:bifunctional non-homologous end joining protein LigD